MNWIDHLSSSKCNVLLLLVRRLLPTTSPRLFNRSSVLSVLSKLVFSLPASQSHSSSSSSVVTVKMNVKEEPWIERTFV